MKITFNGIEYGSVNDMPPAVRQQFDQFSQMLADKNRNGVPDILEQAGAVQIEHHVEERFIIDGREYRSRAELPADVRAVLDQGTSRPADAAEISVGADTVLSSSDDRRGWSGSARGRGSSGLAMLAIGVLLFLLVALLVLWLSGVKPSDLGLR